MTLLSDRAIITITPTSEDEDAVGFLQGLVTNDVSGGDSPGLPTYAGLLTPQGKTIAGFIAWRDGNKLLLDCERNSAAKLVKRLSLYRLRRKIAIELDENLAVHWRRDGSDGAADPRLRALGSRWIAPPGSAGDSTAGYHAHRLSLGVAETAEEIGDLLWLETNAAELNGVSFTKGCFIGQENTARMNWRQKVNRRLVVVPLDRSEEKRRRVAYPEHGLAVDHLRVADIDPELLPDWLREAVAS
ncbi:folate-binding protein [Blastomonas marina]|uniref:CAF17-like 4Fe-4S cluster assembly/insertion protein YgfZ n=1 Tax=Blastomonas marina TaxID=1867408 RepID=UPI002AC992AA|nr:folate-binding protein [Blastomonas marina]WPZ04055.1 folate-binding protein [Blastomonas marina]